MFIANEWKDYEVIDCSAGEKLERWGDYLLVRPDPQVIWCIRYNRPISCRMEKDRQTANTACLRGIGHNPRRARLDRRK